MKHSALPANVAFRPTASLFLVILALLAVTNTTRAQPFSDCDLDAYYSSTDIQDRSALHSLIQSTHRNVLPYTSSAPDVWDALIDLDAADESNQEVMLFYSNRNISSLPHGTTWNREHVWPKSLGVGTSGADYTDVHALRPADANVNSARGNKLFGECGLVDVVDDCKSPAHDDAANDTATDNIIWLPPANRRGDVARIMFYMDVRYEGDASNELDLKLTDCPSENVEEDFGYLSILLQWHEEDPVDDAERERNQKVCESWQGNRNPFIDHEDLASVYFGEPQEANPPNGYDCSSDGGETDGSSTPSPPTTVDGTCNGLQQGDVMITSFQSDNPDQVSMVALNNITGGATLYMTDNAWTGSTFRTNEGTHKLVVPSAGIASRTAFGYGDASGNEWTNEAGLFALAASGDTIILYCVESDDSITHISALSFSGDWLPASNDESTFGTTQSALPSSLPSNTHVALPHFDNYWYTGPRQGSTEILQQGLSDPSNWQGSNDASTVSSQMNFDTSANWTSMSTWMPLVGTAVAAAVATYYFVH